MFLKNLFKYKSWFFLCFVSVLLINIFEIVYLLKDLNPTVIVKSENFKNKQSMDFYKSNSIFGEFKSNYNNLGIVSVKFNTHDRINTDFLQFRIKGQNSDIWYYSAKYKVDQFQNNKYFPFGFPEITDSKNKIYDFEILSLEGIEGNMVSIDSIDNQFLVKNSFSKSYLLKNKILIPNFIFNKVLSFFININVFTYLLMILQSVFLYLFFNVVNFIRYSKDSIVTTFYFFLKHFTEIIINEFTLFISFFKRNKLLFGLLLFVLLLCFGFEMSHFTLSVDEELGISFGSKASGWIKQGRFGIAIFKKILNTSEIVPFWNTFLCVVFLYISVTYFCSIIDLFIDKVNISKNMRTFLLFIFGSSFLSFPINAAYISFSTYNFEISVGILLTALSVKLFMNSIFNKNKTSNLILSVLFLTYSISIYQSFICLFLCSVSFISILLIINKNELYSDFKKNLMILIRLFIVVLVSVFLYKIIDALLGLRYSSTNYVEGYFRWGKQSFVEICLSIKNFYLSNIINNKALFFYKFFLVLIGFGILAILKNLFVIKKNKTAYLFWCLIFFVSPFLLTIVLGSQTLLRTMQSVAFLTGALLIFNILAFKDRLIILILSIFSVLMIFLQSQQISLIFFSDYSRYQQDIILANRIFDQIYSLKLENISQYPIVITGTISQKQTKENIKMEALGWSFFDMSQSRVYVFLKLLGYDFISPNNEQLKIGLDCQNNMPIWPDSGSIKLCDNLIIVKLSK